MGVVVACLLAMLLGFAAHRSSICTVRGMAELVHSRSAYMMISIAKTMLWVLILTVPVFWLVPATGAGLGGWQLSAIAVAGGFLFGLGAAMNGACAYSTMGRLVDGDFAMLMTIIGFAVGVYAFVSLLAAGIVARPQPAPAAIGSALSWLVFVAAALALWGLYELARLWRTRPAERSLPRLVGAAQYRLSTSAALIGLSGATILVLTGPLGYSSTFEVVIESVFGTRPPPPTTRWLILVAVLAGMLLSTLQRGTFRLDWRPRASWARNILGGVLMGLGVAMTPGGNDALVLYGIPSLSPHALPAFAAMIIGIALGLTTMRALLGVEMRVVCRNDLFVTDAAPGKPGAPAIADTLHKPAGSTARELPVQ